MLKEYTAAERKTQVWHELCFDDGRNNGFGFPCDGEGKLLPNVPDAARENLAFCLAHPEMFTRFNKLITYRREYLEPAHGICSCGAEVVLVNQYHGSCQCPECGQWYNLFGQELLPPEAWEC